MKISDISNSLRAKLKLEGFSCEESLNLGAVQTIFYAGKKVRWYIFWPNFIHYYVIEISKPNADFRNILGLHSSALAYTNKVKNPIPRWLRWCIPITVTVIISENGFSEDALYGIQNKKPRLQLGGVNSIILVDVSKSRTYNLKRFGLIGVLPLKRINEYTVNLLSEILEPAPLPEGGANNR
jgi:hypothetical protein